MLPKINGLFRLTRDSELKYSQGGAAILNISIAASEKYKEKETTCFLNAVAFGKVAEIISQYAGAKGTQIYLSGKLQTEQWTDTNGQKKSKNSMTIEGFDFVSNKSNNGQTNQGYQQQPQQQAPQQTYQAPHGNVPVYNEPAPQNQQQQHPNNNIPEIDIDEDEIPF